METVEEGWAGWRARFERRRLRALPDLDDAPEIPAELREPLGRSLAIFQLGESGEGRIVSQIRRCRLASIDEDYRRALACFVAEEGRHARILLRMLRALGAERLRGPHLADELFTRGRRLIGVRTKLLVLLAAEVVGGAFYELLASRLPEGRTRGALAQIASDEATHLEFHAAFFRRELVSWTSSNWRNQGVSTPIPVSLRPRITWGSPSGSLLGLGADPRLILTSFRWSRTLDSAAKRAAFTAGWWTVAPGALAVFMADHRRTLRALGWREPEVLSEVGRRIRATWARCLSPYSSGTAHSHFSTFESEVRQASGMGALRSFG